MAKLTKKEQLEYSNLLQKEFESQKNESELLLVKINKDKYEVWLPSHAEFAEELGYAFKTVKRSDLEVEEEKPEPDKD